MYKAHRQFPIFETSATALCGTTGIRRFDKQGAEDAGLTDAVNFACQSAVRILKTTQRHFEDQDNLKDLRLSLLSLRFLSFVFVLSVLSFSILYFVFFFHCLSSSPPFLLFLLLSFRCPSLPMLLFYPLIFYLLFLSFFPFFSLSE